MAKLYGRDWTREELRQRSGTLRQIAGCTRYELQDGVERGVEICDVRTGSGFRFLVSPSRGLDIVFAEHNGRALNWNSSTGIAHPHTFERDNFGWLRGFTGGLLTTCGLCSFGPPCQDEGEEFGLHDRVSYLPASGVAVRETWRGDECDIEISGSVRQTRVFGPNLLLTRSITARVGENHLTVRDTLTNEGFREEGYAVLYHCNFGFPVVSGHSQIFAPSGNFTARDEASRSTAPEWMQLEAPQPGSAERCYFHQMTPGADGFVRASIWNSQLSFGGYVRYRAKELPNFTQWKMMGAGEYVCGLEPCSAPLASRRELRDSGILPMLKPGESVEFEVELGVCESAP